MRRILWIITAVAVSSIVAAGGEPVREATAAEADFIYLGVLNSGPASESLEMLTDVGIDKTRTRHLLTYLDEHMDDHYRQAIADTVGLCRNLDGRFSNRLALAHELIRQRDSEDSFKEALIQGAKEILGVTTLAPVRRPHMNTPGIAPGPDAIDLVVKGQLTPAAAIARACEVTKKEQASVLDESEAI
jgi:hypothetical protein